MEVASLTIEQQRSRGLVLTFGLLAGSLAASLVGVELANNPGDCIQDAGDIFPTIAPTECFDDLLPQKS